MDKLLDLTISNKYNGLKEKVLLWLESYFKQEGILLLQNFLDFWDRRGVTISKSNFLEYFKKIMKEFGYKYDVISDSFYHKFK